MVTTTPAYRVGFTGTARHPLPPAQLGSLLKVMMLIRTNSPGQVVEWHHGGAKHADAASHILARALGFRTVVHPGPTSDPRDFPGADVVLPRRENLDRNGDIARTTEELIATPAQQKEIRRAGTWSTVRRARPAGGNITLVLPDGTVTGGEE
jgi:hypothetical protein